MYGIKLATGLINTLCEESFIVLNAEAGDESVAGAEEKNTQDPREAGAS
jgi:hypothetical protein